MSVSCAHGGGCAYAPGRAVEIAGHELRCEAQRPDGVHHQDRKVATGARARGERLKRRLGMAEQACGVVKVAIDGLGDVGEQGLQSRSPVRPNKAPRPPFQISVGIGVLTAHGEGQVRQILGAIGDWQGGGIGFYVAIQIGKSGQGRVLQPHLAVKDQFGRRLLETGYADAIAEHVMQVAMAARRGRNVQARGNQPLVIAFQRAEHHPVFAQRHSLAVTIAGHMADRQERH